MREKGVKDGQRMVEGWEKPGKAHLYQSSPHSCVKLKQCLLGVKIKFSPLIYNVTSPIFLPKHPRIRSSQEK